MSAEDYFVFAVTLNIVIPGLPLILRSREGGVSKDEAKIGASWFATREDALLTMRV